MGPETKAEISLEPNSQEKPFGLKVPAHLYTQKIKTTYEDFSRLKGSLLMLDKITLYQQGLVALDFSKMAADTDQGWVCCGQKPKLGCRTADELALSDKIHNLDKSIWIIKSPHVGYLFMFNPNRLASGKRGYVINSDQVLAKTLSAVMAILSKYTRDPFRLKHLKLTSIELCFQYRGCFQSLRPFLPLIQTSKMRNPTVSKSDKHFSMKGSQIELKIYSKTAMLADQIIPEPASRSTSEDTAILGASLSDEVIRVEFKVKNPFLGQLWQECGLESEALTVEALKRLYHKLLTFFFHENPSNRRKTSATQKTDWREICARLCAEQLSKKGADTDKEAFIESMLAQIPRRHRTGFIKQVRTNLEEMQPAWCLADYFLDPQNHANPAEVRGELPSGQCLLDGSA